MGLKQFAQLRCGAQLTGGDNDLRVPRLPFGKRVGDHGRGNVVGVFHKGHTRAGEKPLRLDRILQACRVLAQL